jgi:hypothetical protein
MVADRRSHLLILLRCSNCGRPQDTDSRLSHHFQPVTIRLSSFPVCKADHKGADVPDYLEAVEHPDNQKGPGTTVCTGLPGHMWGEQDLLEPDRVVLRKHLGVAAGWQWPLEGMPRVCWARRGGSHALTRAIWPPCPS